MTTSHGIIVSLCDYSGAWVAPFARNGYTVVLVDPKHDGGETTAGTLADHTGLVRRKRVAGGTTEVYTLAMTAGQLRDWFDARCPSYEARLRALSRLLGLDSTLPVIGVTAAPPCTDFSGSGARWWKAKDASGQTDASVRIVRDCLAVIGILRPRWWALENPVGRLARLVPELGKPALIFDPCDFAGWADAGEREDYTKRTCLWGDFDADLVPARVKPVMVEKRRKDGTVVRGSWMWANLGGKSERTKALRSKTPTGFARAFYSAQHVTYIYPEVAA